MSKQQCLKVEIEKKIAAPVLQIIRLMGSLADQMGQRAFLAGGFVRDLLLQVPTSDLDVAVEGDGVAYASRLGQLLQVKTTAHGQFGTASLTLADGWRIDIASTRTETYAYAGALPDVRPASLPDDLARRDFSINAMAVAINRADFGLLTDICHGQDDLARQQIRVLHPRSFWDDPTRLIRAARFAARFGFRLEPGSEILSREAIAGHALRLVSPPRIREELLAVFRERDPGVCLELLAGLGIWPELDPLMPKWPDVRGLLQEIPAAIQVGQAFFPQADRPLLYLTAICAGLAAEDAACMLLRLQVPRRYGKEILLTLERYRRYQGGGPVPDPPPGFWLAHLDGLPPEGILFFLAVARTNAASICRYLAQRRQVRLSLSGADLGSLGIPPGPQRKQVLELILQARLDGAPGSRQAEIALAERFIAEMRGGKT